MSIYVLEIGESLAKTLERAASAQPAQFAGYWKNIDFWIREFHHLVDAEVGHQERFEQMKSAYTLYVQEHGGPHNIDEFGEPFQSVAPTTTRGERKRIVKRTKRALTKLGDRALNLNIIDLQEYDEFLGRLKTSQR